MMRMRMVWVAVVGIVLCVAALRAAEPVSDDLAPILHGLASEKFADREAALALLAKVPPDEMDQVTDQAEKEADPEIKACLETRVKEMGGELLRLQAGKPDAAAHIRGRVIDPVGNPVADVLVSATTDAAGPDLRLAVRPSARTDLAGRFDLPVPVGDVNYSVTLEPPAFADMSRVLIPDDREMEWKLEKRGVAPPTVGSVVDSSGMPVAGRDILLIGEYGRRMKTQTKADGSFEFASMTGYYGQAIVVMQVGDQVLPLQLLKTRVGRAMPPLALTLVKEANLEGQVTEAGTGKGLAGVKVTARPPFANDFAVEAVTAADGTYKIAGVPPGSYLIMASAVDHFQMLPRGGEVALAPIDLESGMRTSVDLLMARMAAVRGEVRDAAGKPVPGAIVGIKSTQNSDYREQWRYVHSDEKGAFIIGTAHTGEALSLVAYSSKSGLVRSEVKPMEAGELRGKVMLQMAGATHVHGVVRDVAGKQVADIICKIDGTFEVAVTTGADGAFDLGQIAQAGEVPPKVIFCTPHPKTDRIFGNGFFGKTVPVASRKDAPPFYLGEAQALALPLAADTNLNVTLQPAQLLEITGVVNDASGKPVADATVCLLTGDATETWVQMIKPQQNGRGGLAVLPRDVVLARMKTAADGTWRAWVVRDNGVGEPIGWIETDWKTYCVGMDAPAGTTLVRGIEVPTETGVREVQITLGK